MDRRHKVRSRTEEIAELLRRTDPLGLIAQTAENLDEYNSEAALIAARLDRCKSVETCQRMIWEVFTYQLGLESAGPEAAYAELATLVWEIGRGSDADPGRD